MGAEVDSIEHFVVRKLEQEIVRGWVGEGIRLPERETTNVRGVPARRLWTDGFDELEAYLLVRDGVVYTIVFGGHEERDKRDILSGFSFLEP